MSSDEKETNEIIEVETLPFTESGIYSDEIRLVFDDRRKLFASENFLKMLSPVFEAMFEHNFEEKQFREVTIQESYDDFLKFMICCHPGILKPLETDDENVVPIIYIADKYQVPVLIKRSQSWMKERLDSTMNIIYTGYKTDDQIIGVEMCLQILEIAIELNYNTVIEYATSTIARFPHRIYYGSYEPDTFRENDEKARQTSQEEFQKLPAEIRCQILSKRLAFDRDNRMETVNYNAYKSTYKKSLISEVRFCVSQQMNFKTFFINAYLE